MQVNGNAVILVWTGCGRAMSGAWGGAAGVAVGGAVGGANLLGVLLVEVAHV